MRRFISVVLVLLGSVSHADTKVAVVGVTDAMDFIERWAKVEGTAAKETDQAFSFRSDKHDLIILAPKSRVALHKVANTLFKADIALIAVDATQGPLPVNREHILLARQAGVPVVAILLANVDALHELVPQDAAELLELEAIEMVELLSAYEIGGNDSLLVHDSMHENLGPGDGNGLLQIANALSRQRATRQLGASPEAQKAAVAQVYFLSEAESFAPLAAISNPTELQVWSEGSSVPAKVSTTGIPRPGDIKEVSLRAERGISAHEGSRILLMHDGHVIGIGVVSETSAL